MNATNIGEKFSVLKRLGSVIILMMLPAIQAVCMLESKSLSVCMPNSAIAATYLHAIYTPDNQTLEFHVDGDSQVASNVTIQVKVLGYGYNVFSETISPCDYPGLKSICPMIAGPLPDLRSNLQIPPEQARRVPNIVYYIPDLDGKIVAWFNSSSTGNPLACVECELSNGKTVYQVGAAWAIGILTAICLASSAVMWSKGYVAASTHLAAKTWSLISYYQAVACIGMASTRLPPIVKAWTQNFQWTMGIIHLGFLQKIATWYLRASGGHPTTVLSPTSSSLSSISVQKRTNVGTGKAFSMNQITVRGIQRACFIASIEISNFFMTGYMWFIIVISALIIVVVAMRYICDFVARKKSTNTEKWEASRNNWFIILKGMILRFLFFSFLPLVILCVHELTRRDSVAECIIAVFTILSIMYALGRGTFFTIKLRQQSLQKHGNAAYLLYSKSHILNHWGFLYSPFKATHGWFLAPTLICMLIKGAFIGGSQGNSTVLALVVTVMDVLYLVSTIIFRPYVDRSLNVTNIAVCVVNVLNAGLLLEFSDIFSKPPLATGVSGIIFFFINLPFVALLLVLTLVTALRCLFYSKKSDCRYIAHFKDGRRSFVPSRFPLFPFRQIPSSSGYASTCSWQQKWRNASEEAIVDFRIDNHALDDRIGPISAVSGSDTFPSSPFGVHRKLSLHPPTTYICPDLTATGVSAQSSGASISRVLSDSALHIRTSQYAAGVQGSSGTVATGMSKSSDALPLEEIAMASVVGAALVPVNSRLPSPEIIPSIDSLSHNNSGSSVDFAPSSGCISPKGGVDRESSFAGHKDSLVESHTMGSGWTPVQATIPVIDPDVIEEISPRNTMIMSAYGCDDLKSSDQSDLCRQLLADSSLATKENHGWPITDWSVSSDKGKKKTIDSGKGGIVDNNQTSSSI